MWRSRWSFIVHPTVHPRFCDLGILHFLQLVCFSKAPRIPNKVATLSSLFDGLSENHFKMQRNVLAIFAPQLPRFHTTFSNFCLGPESRKLQIRTFSNKLTWHFCFPSFTMSHHAVRQMRPNDGWTHYLGSQQHSE